MEENKDEKSLDYDNMSLEELKKFIAELTEKYTDIEDETEKK